MNILKEVLRQKIILWTVIGVCAGISLGLILKTFTLQPWTKRNVMYLKFPGELFMRIVNCLILPLITSSIVSATCNLKKSGKYKATYIVIIVKQEFFITNLKILKCIGRIGTMALYYYTMTTSLGIILSVILVQTIRPGDLLKDKNIITQNTTRYSITVDTILDLFR